jgi:hypothetical protein
MRQADPIDALQVVAPCPMLWSDMQGDDRVRFCDRCRKSVYNLAAMSRSEALTIIGGVEGQACVQLTRRPDGTVTTGDCWTLLRQARQRGVVAFAVMLVIVLAGGLRAPIVGLRNLAALLRPTPAPAGQPRMVRGQATLRALPTRAPLVPEQTLGEDDEVVTLGLMGRAR